MNFRRRTVLVLSALETWSIGEKIGAASLFETLKGYAARGWRVIYLTNRKTTALREAHATEVTPSIPGVETFRFGARRSAPMIGKRLYRKFDRVIGFPAASAEALAGMIGRNKVDLVYAYEQGAVLGAARFRKNTGSKVPLINRYQGVIFGEQFRNPLVCARKFETFSALRKPADAFVMTDDGTLGKQALRFWNKFVDDENLLFLRNGIDLSMLKQESERGETLRNFGLSPDRLCLLMVSRLTGWKRVDRGLQLMADLGEEGRQVQLAICGDGKSREELEKLACSLGLTSRVFFLGGLQREDVAKLLNAADIFLSLYDVSNCGNPLFEALSYGPAVVTLNNGGTGRVVEDGINGRLLRPGDRRSLVNAVRELIADKTLRKRLRAGARRWADANLCSWPERMQIEIDWVEKRLFDAPREDLFG